MRKILDGLTSAIILAFAVSSAAQTINITGTVLDSSNSQPISGATVALLEFPQFTAITASNGTFALQGTPVSVRSDITYNSTREIVLLDGGSLSITNAKTFSPVEIDVYEGNGKKIGHWEKSANAHGAIKVDGLWQASGMHYIKVRIDNAIHTFVSTGTNESNRRITQSSPISTASLSKITAEYTLEVNAANFIGKRITMTATTGNAGTIKLAHLSTQTGVWTNVTPSGFLNADFGAQDVLADPVRPGELYAFNCNMGVWKSTNAGATWTKITAPGVMEKGRAWGECIDLNINRNPATPPAMWACQGYGDLGGIYKSTDGGVTWANYAVPFGTYATVNPYSPQVDPYDSNHLISGLHHDNGCVESTDGGVTWRNVTGNMSGGGSWYPFFINTGNATTTRTTWIALSETTGGVAGTVRTTNGGTTWTKVSGNEHAHGNSQIYQANGVVFMAGVYAAEGWGALRSTDFGVTWTHVGLAGGESNVYGTPNHVYVTCSGATTGQNNPSFQIGNAAGTTFTSATTPAGMTNGPKNAAVTYDPAIGKYVLVGGCWNAGLWRYIEP
jgi:hypothetical protein